MKEKKRITNIRKLPKFLFSDFVYIYNLKNRIRLCHSLLIKKIFLTRREYKILQNYLKGKDIQEKNLIFNLYKKGFLIKNKKEDGFLYKKAQEIVKNWQLKTLFLVVTDKCNFQM